MTQPTATVSEQDVERLLRRDYPEADHAEIRVWIRETKLGIPRVVAACLKNAAGSTQRLRQQLRIARDDPRDVLAEAEYPLAVQKGFGANLLPWQWQEIYDKDWEQYQKWFTRP